MFGADVVAVRGDELLVVELKMSFTKTLFEQLLDRARWADTVYAAVPGIRGGDKKRLKAGGCRCHGIGILVVDGLQVHRVLKAQDQPFSWQTRRRYRMKMLANRAEAMDHEIAGLPCCRQLREQRLQRELPLAEKSSPKR